MKRNPLHRSAKAMGRGKDPLPEHQAVTMPNVRFVDFGAQRRTVPLASKSSLSGTKYCKYPLFYSITCQVF